MPNMLASADCSIRLWQGNSGELCEEWKAPFTSINALSFCNNSRTLLVGGNSQNLLRIDIVSKEKDYFKLEESSVKSICSSFDQSKVAIGYGSGKVVVLNTHPLSLSRSYSPCKMSVTSSAFTKDSLGVFCSDIHGHISLLIRNQAEAIVKPDLYTGSLSGLSVSKTSGDLAVFCGRFVSIYDTTQNKYKASYEMGGRCRGAYTQSENNQILVATDNGSIFVLDDRSSKPKPLVEGLSSTISATSIHPNGNTYAISYTDGGIEERDIRYSKSIISYPTNRLFGPAVIAYQPTELLKTHIIERTVSNTSIPISQNLFGTPLTDKSNAKSSLVLSVPMKSSETVVSAGLEEEDTLNFSFINPVSSPSVKFSTPHSSVHISAKSTPQPQKPEPKITKQTDTDKIILERLSVFQSLLDDLRLDFNRRLTSIESRLERLESK